VSALIETRDLAFSYGESEVFKDVSLALEPGELAALAGPNGAGKTTLLKVLSGVLAPRAGSVTLEGRPLNELGPREIARRTAFVGQELAAEFSFTVEELVLMGRAPHLGRLALETERDFEIAREAMKSTGVHEFADRAIDEVSGGERQRAFLAMALAQEPKLLLLDEPASHLDLAHQIAFFDLLAELVGQRGIAALVAGHDLNVAADYASRLLVLAGGKLVADDEPGKVLTAELIREHWGAEVVITASPASGRPHVVAVPGGSTNSASPERQVGPQKF